MRVAVDMHFLQDKHQGIKTCLTGLYEEVVRISNEHTFVFIFSHEDETSEKWRQLGEVAFLGTESRDRRLAYAVARTLNAVGGVDVAHFSAVAPAFVPAKVIVTIHDILFLTHPEYFERAFRWQQRVALAWTLHRADMVTVVSRYTERTIRSVFPNIKKPIKLLPNGINQNSLSNQKEAACEFVNDRYGLTNYILTVGRIDPRKNHKGMLQAYQQLAERQGIENIPSFVVVGDVDNRYHEGAHLIESAAERLPVIWIRNANDIELKHLYEAALCLVMASHAEGFGLPVLEAMAAGTPVIASRNTAMPEVIGNAGLLVDANNPHSIEAAYRKIIMNESLRYKYSNIGQKRAAQQTWRHSAYKYLSILDEM